MARYVLFLVCKHLHLKAKTMSKTNRRNNDLPILPALNVAVLSLGAAVHGNPSLLRPVLGWVHTLGVAIFA